MKAFVLSVLCLGLVVGVCLLVRRMLDTITAPPQALRPKLRPATAPPDAILQQLTRFRAAEGNETIRGTLAAEFSAGQRDAILFVAFCPPFEQLPDVEAHISDDLAARVKVAQLLHNGAQFEVRLSEPAENCLTVTVEFIAAEPEPTNCHRSQGRFEA